MRIKMDNLDYIEDYFTNTPGPELVREFENRIQTDSEFAEEVAFYLSALKTATEISREEKKSQFRELYQHKQNAPNETRIRNMPARRKLVYSIAAAAVVAGIIFGTYIMTRPVAPQSLAKHYINEQLQTLSVTMSGKSDSIQTGLRLYNDGKPAAALVQFETIIQSDSSNFTAKKYAGLSALQLKEYDTALSWFGQLDTYNLYSNPAQFYTALTLMERNNEGDVPKAKILLQQIAQNNLEGKETAQEWLKKIK